MVEKAFNALGHYAQAKINVFYQLTLLPNNIVLTSSGWFLLRTMVFFVMGRSAENIEEKKKTGRRKTLKSEEKEKRRIRGKSNNKNIHLWF